MSNMSVRAANPARSRQSPPIAATPNLHRIRPVRLQRLEDDVAAEQPRRAAGERVQRQLAE
jgi:hypothetical protein